MTLSVCRIWISCFLAPLRTGLKARARVQQEELRLDNTVGAPKKQLGKVVLFFFSSENEETRLY